MKTINLKLSKKLYEAGLLDDIETEYKYQLLPNIDNSKWRKEKLVRNWNGKGRIYKTFLLEEAIEFLPQEIKSGFWLNIGKYKGEWYVQYEDILYNSYIAFEGEELLEVIEKMLEYLLDNNLLGKQ